MLLTIPLVALCVIGATIVTPTRGDREPLTKYCNDLLTPTTSYTREELIQLDSLSYILDMDVSHHTGHIYIVDDKYHLRVIYVVEQETKPLIEERLEVEAVAVDKNVPKVYIGGNTGLKIYDEYTGVITNVPEIKRFVYGISVPKISPAIYVRHSDSGIYKYNNITSRGIKLNVDFERIMTHGFVADGEENLYYTTKDNKRDVTKIQLKGHPNAIKFNDGTFFYLAADNAGRVHGANKDGVYRLKADGSKQQLINKLDFGPWYMRFDKDNNIIFGTSGNKIIRFKMNYDCISWPTQAVTNMSMALDSINRIQYNVTHGLDDIGFKLNETFNKQNINIHNSLLSAIEPIRAFLHKTSLKYDNTLLNINNDINELNECLDQNYRQPGKGLLVHIVSKIEEERKMITNKLENMLQHVIKTLNTQNMNKWEIIDAMSEKYDSLISKMDNHIKTLNASLADNNKHLKLAQIEKIERKIKLDVISRVNNLDLTVLLSNMTEI